MRRLFADSSYYIAVLFARDHLHDDTLRIVREFERSGSVRFITSEAVFAEVLAFFSRFDAATKAQVATFVEALLNDTSITVVPVTGDLLRRSLKLYAGRADQPYSLTDCATMEICRDLSIAEILTADTDFEREGFAILLKP